MGTVYNFVFVNFCSYLFDQLRWGICFSGSPSLCFILFYLFFFSLYCIFYSWLIHWVDLTWLGGASNKKSKHTSQPQSGPDYPLCRLYPGDPRRQGGGDQPINCQIFTTLRWYWCLNAQCRLKRKNRQLFGRRKCTSREKIMGGRVWEKGSRLTFVAPSEWLIRPWTSVKHIYL